MSHSFLAGFSRLLASVALLVVLFLGLPTTGLFADDGAADALPANLDHGLRRLLAWHHAQPQGLSAPERHTRLFQALPGQAAHVQTNADATRAVVDLTLNGTVPGASVRAALGQLGAEVLAEANANRNGGRISAEIPLDQVEGALRVPGVFSISLVHRPWRRVGKATSQGVGVLRADKVNQMGYDGTGITVGVISDSFDKGTDTATYSYATHAADDVRNGDLPGVGNPLGHLTPVTVVNDAASGDYQFDEGRAMLQIIHDLAPGARLMFQAAGKTEETLASAITTLRSQTNPSPDVIVDDFTFPEEPYFSDGPAALAAKEAATSVLLPGRPVVYVSAAGNAGDIAYSADFTPISDTAARAGTGIGNLKLNEVPTGLTVGGFHNFNPKPGKTSLAQKVTVEGSTEISFQWDDPFLPGAATANYSLLVFDAEGGYLSKLSGTDNNTLMGKPIQIVDLDGGSEASKVTYQIAIARTGALTLGTVPAGHLHYVMNGGNPTVKFMGYNHPTTSGHNAGANVIGVAAYPYNKLAEPEAFSSLGPVTIYFDAQGARLPTPEVRQQPAVAAVDGVDTSFFPPGALTQADGKPGTDTDGDGLPNFFGTSAAAPHVAGVAALLLQAAGGHGSLTGAQVLALLQATASTHDLDPNSSSATLHASDGSTTTLAATADESDASSVDANVFHLTFDGAAGRALSKVVIDLGPSGLKFDPTTDNGFPFTEGTKVGLSAGDVTATLDGSDTTLTLKFAPGVFSAGRALNFGIDRDPTGSDTGGNSADLLAGATVKVHTTGTGGTGKAQGALENQIGSGYSPAAGFGLVNAQAAVQALRAHPPAKPASGLISGDILVTSSDSRVLEVAPDGTQVQTFTLPSAVTNNPSGFVYHFASETLVDGRGDLVLLYDTANASNLYLIDPQNGQATVLTAPGWEPPNDVNTQSLFDEIVASGPYVYATNGDGGFRFGEGPLLRFDPATGTSEPFGMNSVGFLNRYSSLAVGPDGLLYAMDFQFAADTIVDVYDPNTLQRLRSVTLYLVHPGEPARKTANAITVGPKGEFYALSTDRSDTTLYKLDASGQTTATLALPGGESADYRTSNLRANAQGAVLVGNRDPLLIDPAFQTVTVLNAFGGLSSDTDTPTATATFVP